MPQSETDWRTRTATLTADLSGRYVASAMDVGEIAMPDETAEAPLEKRRWCYAQPPDTYGIAPCACGRQGTEWSEFKGRIWCSDCGIDFVPAHNGIFDGPIGVQTSAMLGIRFDRINLETMQFEPFEMASSPGPRPGTASKSGEPIKDP